MVDDCGNPLEVIMTAGKVNDVSVAPELIAAVDLAEAEAVSADKGYDSDKLRAQIEESGSKQGQHSLQTRPGRKEQGHGLVSL